MTYADGGTYADAKRDVSRCMGAKVIAETTAARLEQGATLSDLVARSDAGSGDAAAKEWRRGVMMTTRFVWMGVHSAPADKLNGLSVSEVTGQLVAGQCADALGLRGE
ncbi:hypothetical protein ACW9YQ_32245 (plasmid) [Paraburkholderia strydomiana]